MIYFRMKIESLETYYKTIDEKYFKLDLHIFKKEFEDLLALIEHYPYGDCVTRSDLILFLKFTAREKCSYHHLMFETEGAYPCKIRKTIMNCRNSIIYNLEKREENNLTKTQIDKAYKGFERRLGFKVKIGERCLAPWSMVDGTLKPVHDFFVKKFFFVIFTNLKILILFFIIKEHGLEHMQKVGSCFTADGK